MNVSNRLSLMFVKSSIGKSICGSIPQCAKMKEYLKAIENSFVTPKIPEVRWQPVNPRRSCVDIG